MNKNTSARPFCTTRLQCRRARAYLSEPPPALPRSAKGAFCMRCPQVPTALVLLIVSALPAGPILSNKRKIADELKSLAGLTQMRMHVAPVPTRFKDMGVRKAKIDAFLRQELEESGFKIVTDTEAPRCILRIIGEVDERFPDAVSIGTVLEIEQRVTVHRIEQDLTFAVKAHLVREGVLLELPTRLLGGFGLGGVCTI